MTAKERELEALDMELAELKRVQQLRRRVSPSGGGGDGDGDGGGDDVWPAWSAPPGPPPPYPSGP